jgi:hypothetical protein
MQLKISKLIRLLKLYYKSNAQNKSHAKATMCTRLPY